MNIELDYIKVGDYYIPNLMLDEPPEVKGFMGKYAGLRRDYLKEYRPVVWMVLVLTPPTAPEGASDDLPLGRGVIWVTAR